MTDAARELLRAACACPEEDAPRAMLADELQSSDSRTDRYLGGFIAEQLAARHTEVMYLRAVLGRELFLLFSDVRFGVQIFPSPNVLTHGAVYWSGSGRSDPIEPYRWNPTDQNPIFRVNRGFVCHAEMTCAEFLRCAVALYARHPVQYGVTLCDRAPRADRVPPRGDSSGPRTIRYMFSRCDPEIPDTWRDMPYRLPHPIFDLFGPCPKWDWWREFPTEAIANDALAAACSLYGREAATLWLRDNRID